jgi:HlyD family secretion protein
VQWTIKKDQASLTYARLSYQRDQGLHEKGIVSQDNLENDKNLLDQATAQIDVDLAAIKQRKIALEAAKVNLDYTDTVSPHRAQTLRHAVARLDSARHQNSG